MTQAEKIAKIGECIELIELALASNDRQMQLEYVRKLMVLRKELQS